MVKIKPARRQPTKSASRVRTPQRKISRPSRLASRRPPSKLSQKIKKCIWVFIGVLFLFSITFFMIYRSILSIALDERSTQTIVLVPDDLDDSDTQVVFAFLAEEQRDSFIAILPVSTEVAVPGGYGNYRLSAVYPLLELEKKDAQFMRASFSRGLGRTVDTVYGVSELVDEDELESGELFSLILKTALKEKRVPTELIRLWHFVKNDIPVVKLNALSELSGLVAEKKAAVIAEAQECPIGVLNASLQSGTASLLSTLFEQSGLITIRTSSYPELEPTTKIYISENNTCAPVLETVKKAFVQLPQIEVNQAMVTQYRAPIVIIIGEDFE